MTQNSKLVMIFGTFDGLHAGHRFLVAQAQKRGNVTAVVGTDSNVENIKGRLPLEKLEQRIAILQQEFPAIRVIAGSTEDFLTPLRAEKPDLLLLGYDQKLPPAVSFEDLKCPWERADALEPYIYKSSLMSQNKQQGISSRIG